MQKQKWTWAKKLYLALSIMLTIQIIPLVGTILNNSFGYAIIGVVLSITILSRTKRDNRSAAGAVLGLITFLMAIISGLLMYTLSTSNILIYPSPIDSDNYILKTLLGGLWMACNWLVGIAAAIISFINTFSKRDQMVSREYVSVGTVVTAENNPVYVMGNVTTADNNAISQNQAVQLGFGAPVQTVTETLPQATVVVSPKPVVPFNIPQVLQADNTTTAINSEALNVTENQVVEHADNLETIAVDDVIIPTMTVQSSDTEIEPDEPVSDENDRI